MTRKLFAALIGVSLSLSVGCLPKGFKNGHFEGTLHLKPQERGKLNAETYSVQQYFMSAPAKSEPVSNDPALNFSTTSEQTLIDTLLVTIDFKFEKDTRGQVDIKDTQGKTLYLINFEKINLKKFYLSISSIHPDLVEMKIEPKSDGCFSSSGDLIIQVCLKDNKFITEVSHKNQVPFFTLIGDRFAKEVPFPLETPISISVPDAIARALKQNFDSRVQFEHTIQARLKAKAAFFSLVPHLNLGNLLANFPVSFNNALALVGDIAPFLLPNRWFMAKEAGQLFQAEKYAEILMQADLATQVEGLSYALQRDLDILDFTQFIKSRVLEARDSVLALETLGTFPLGSAQHLSAYANTLELDVDSLIDVVQLDRRAIAQALGYHNPDAVSGMVFDAEFMPIDRALPLDMKELGEVALQRSFELQQIDALIIYAEYQKEETYFGWLDPSADPTKQLGIALGEVIAIGQSKLRELKIQREQLQSVLLQKMNASVYEYNNAVEIYPLVTRGLEIQERRVKRVLEQVVPDSGLNTLDIEAIYQDYVANWIRQKQAIVGFRIARSNIDRMLLKGYYASLFNTYFGPLKLNLSEKRPQ